MIDKCQGKICPKGKICNPTTGYCVNISGSVGKQVLKNQSNKTDSNTKIDKKKISNPILTNNLDIFLNQLNLHQLKPLFSVKKIKTVDKAIEYYHSNKSVFSKISKKCLDLFINACKFKNAIEQVNLIKAYNPCNIKIAKDYILEIVQYMTPKLLKKNPKKIYLFGDNLARKGYGGQAIIRDQPNAYGIATKKKGGTSESTYYTDEDYNEAIKVIDKDLKKALSAGKIIVIPKNGIGTGLAKLNKKAPKIYKYLNQRLKKLIDLYGVNQKSDESESEEEDEEESEEDEEESESEDEEESEEEEEEEEESEEEEEEEEEEESEEDESEEDESEEEEEEDESEEESEEDDEESDSEDLIESQYNVDTVITMHGLKRKNIIGDGNCFFRTIAYFVFGNQNKHKEVRKQVTDYLQKNMNDYLDTVNSQMMSDSKWTRWVKAHPELFEHEEDPIAPDATRDIKITIFNKYIEIMSKTGVWAEGTLEIMGAAIAFDKQINVYSYGRNIKSPEDAERSIHMYPHSDVRYQGPKSINILNEGQVHYIALIPQ